MLRRLLEIIADGKPVVQTELASQLGTEVSEINEMLKKLGDLGYLRDLSCSEGSPSCKGCPSKNGCFFGSNRHIWTLTDKGRNAIS